MRIDFAASYKDVSRLLNVSSKPASSTDGLSFEQDLQGASVQPSKTLGDLPEPQQPAALVSHSSTGFPDMRSMLRLESSGIDRQLHTPAVSLETSPLDGVLTSESVKTPTLVEVKRVQVEKQQIVQDHLPQLGSEEVRARLHTMSEKIGLDPKLSMAVVKAESSFNSVAVSSDGHASKGLFQLLDTTGKFLLAKTEGADRKYDPFNPDLNMELGTNYLKYLHEIFSSSTELPNNLKTCKAADGESLEKFAVAAFNAGEGRVASAQGRSERAGKDPSYYEQVAPFLPRSTREYVTKVQAGKSHF